MARRRPASRFAPTALTTLRIIGGRLRGSKILYNGDPGTRPMKERVREAVFNLVGPSVKGKHAVDLFAGTGSLGLEALSRGAAQATFIERHRPTLKTLRENIAALRLDDVATVVASDTFFWSADLPLCLRPPADDGSKQPRAEEAPWLVFCSPPYALYRERTADMLELVDRLMEHAPAGSVVVVEADSGFDFGQLARSVEWDVRQYAPAVVGIWRTGG